MKDQRTTSKFEKFLFGITRIFTIGGVLGAIALIILLGFNLLLSGNNTYVSLDDINIKASAKNKQYINIPENLKTYMSGNNEKILQGWLDIISNHEQKQEFVNNLSDVISDAELEIVNIDINHKTMKLSKFDKNDIVKIINKYRAIKLAKFNKSEMDQYKEIGQKVASYIAISWLIIFILIMSLILIMLAIERNTRYRRNEGEIP